MVLRFYLGTAGKELAANQLFTHVATLRSKWYDPIMSLMYKYSIKQ